MLKKTAASIALVFTLLSLSALASDYEVASIQLKGEGGASGEATFRTVGFMPGEYSFGLTAYGLKPNSIYSVWLSGGYKSDSKAALGIGSNHFKTNGSGVGRYVTTVSLLKLRDFTTIEVDFHPGNDPNNTADLITALKGRLRFY